jgi:hypothetical protein
MVIVICSCDLSAFFILLSYARASMHDVLVISLPFHLLVVVVALSRCHFAWSFYLCLQRCALAIEWGRKKPGFASFVYINWQRFALDLVWSICSCSDLVWSVRFLRAVMVHALFFQWGNFENHTAEVKTR